METEQQQNNKARKSLIFTNSQTETERNGNNPVNYIDVPYSRSQKNISEKNSNFS